MHITPTSGWFNRHAVRVQAQTRVVEMAAKQPKQMAEGLLADPSALRGVATDVSAELFRTLASHGQTALLEKLHSARGLPLAHKQLVGSVLISQCFGG